MTSPSRSEVEAAFRTYLKLGAETHDWNAWADLFTDDALYIEVQYGTFHGREAIRRWIVETMQTVPDMYFPPPKWHVIDGDRVVFYLDNVLPNPHPHGSPPFGVKGFSWCEGEPEVHEYCRKMGHPQTMEGAMANPQPAGLFSKPPEGATLHPAGFAR